MIVAEPGPLPGAAPSSSAPGPAVLTGPPATSTDPAATFTFGSAAGSSVRCSVDGAAPVDCTDGLNLTDLADGLHTVTAVQTDALGRASAPTTWRWEVQTTALRLTAKLAKKGRVAGNRVTVMCKVTSDAIRTCAVGLYARVGKRVTLIASGKRTNRRAGVRSLGVKLKVNRKGVRLLSRTKRTLKVSLRARAQPFTRPKAKVTVRAKIRPARAVRRR